MLRQVLNNKPARDVCVQIEDALQGLGATLDDVTRTRMFVTDIVRDQEAIGRAHGEFFRLIKPASTMVEVRRLIEPDLVVEIEASAIIT